MSTEENDLLKDSSEVEEPPEEYAEEAEAIAEGVEVEETATLDVIMLELMLQKAHYLEELAKGKTATLEGLKEDIKRSEAEYEAMITKRVRKRKKASS